MNCDHTYLVTPAGDLILSRCTNDSQSSSVENKVQDDIVEQNHGSSRDDVYRQDSSHRLLGGKSDGVGPLNCNEYDGPSSVMGSSVNQKPQWAGMTFNESDCIRDYPSTSKNGDINCSVERGSELKPSVYMWNGPLPSMDQNAVEYVPSFDYSHDYHVRDDIGKSSLSEPLQHENDSRHSETQDSVKNGDIWQPLNGIPVFFGGLCQIKVTKLSAHPLGTHCLLISSEGLLFVFGSRNEHGQMGNGTREGCSNPTILTPILENGGKAMDCAAGKSHSLVIVKTDGKRVKKYLAKKRSPQSIFSRVTDDKFGENSTAVTSSLSSFSGSGHSYEPPLCLHQVYAFGSNSHMKLGLVDSRVDESRDILLPRRVALHCQVSQHPGTKKGVKYGIFRIAASVNHSAALVRRSNGSTELYTWGYARDFALGLDVPHAKVVVTPTLVRNFPSYLNCQSSRKYPSNEAAISTLLASALSKSFSLSESSSNSIAATKTEVLNELVLGDRQTFVCTSGGRVLVFGSSDLGLLGMGTQSRCVQTPTEIKFSETCRVAEENNSEARISNLSVGLHHAVAIDQNGSLWRWGSTKFGQLGLRQNCSYDDNEILWHPSKYEHFTSSHPNKRSVAFACCGIDATVMVLSCGSVLSCGKRTGRLGQGGCEYLNSNDKDDCVCEPTPMFGGVKLWHNNIT